MAAMKPMTMESAPVSQLVLPVRERILGAAKELIARKGPVVTTVRDICEATGVNVAAVNYYFGSKETLVKIVLLALLEPLNVQRREMLEEAKRQHGSGPLPVPVILDALLRPLVLGERSADGGRLFVRTEQHLRAVPDSEYTRYVAEHLDHYAQIFLDALARSLPYLTRAEIIWRYEFVRGSALHVLGNCDPISGKLQLLSSADGMIDVEDDELVFRQIMANATLGIASPPAWNATHIRTSA
jgi:AcrR family transcriptional regulator